MKFVDGLSIHEIVRRTGHDRNTVRRALRSDQPPRYERPPRPSKLDRFRDEVKRLLQEDPRIPAKRIRELIEELGYEGGKSILDDYVRELRPLYRRHRTYQRTLYRPAELLQFDLFEPRQEIPVGHGQTRRGYVVTAELGYSRALAAALVFSKEFEDIAFGMSRCLTRLGALPEQLVWDREGAIHSGGGRPRHTWRLRSRSAPALPASELPSRLPPNGSPASPRPSARTRSTKSCAACHSSPWSSSTKWATSRLTPRRRI